MVFVWDYDTEKLSKTESGKAKILERAINYGPGNDYKIKLSEVKKYWNKLSLFPRSRRLFELLIWGKYLSSPKSKKIF